MVTAPLASQLAPLVNCAKLSGGGGAKGGAKGGGGGGAEPTMHTQAQYDVQPTVDAYELNFSMSDEN